MLQRVACFIFVENSAEADSRNFRGVKLFRIFNIIRIGLQLEIAPASVHSHPFAFQRNICHRAEAEFPPVREIAVNIVIARALASAVSLSGKGYSLRIFGTCSACEYKRICPSCVICEADGKMHSVRCVDRRHRAAGIICVPAARNL